MERKAAQAPQEEESTRMTTGFSPEVLLDNDLTHYLVLDGPGGTELRREIGEEPVVLGRTSDADFCLPDNKISRRHCRLQVIDSQLTVYDLGSTNGTYIDGERVSGRLVIPNGSTLHVGGRTLRHERRSRRDAERATELERDLRKAEGYVRALLPPPLEEGPVRTNWCFTPSALLGGDAFGYYELDETRFVLYLLDVCGHGAGPALHTVSVLNVLRNRSLPGVDFVRPEQVLAGLNRAFQMDEHDGMTFSLWYGVFDRPTRRLDYASAGHPPALLVPPDRALAEPLQTRSLAIGSFPDIPYRSQATPVASGARLYVFSDGVFEFVNQEGREGTIEDFQRLVLQAPLPGTDEALRLQLAVQAQADRLDDDFTLLVAEFD